MEADILPYTEKKWTHVMTCENKPVLTLSIRRPAFPTSGKIARMERYFSELEQQWRHRWETVLYPKACHAKSDASENAYIFLPWQAKLDFHITLWRPPLLSLRLDAVETAANGPAHTFCMGETWDCNTGYPRTLRSFYPVNAYRWRRTVIEEIKSQAKTQLASGESLLDPDCTQIMERTFDPNRFYLTEKGASIFYPLYLLGSYAEGIPIFPFTIPEI